MKIWPPRTTSMDDISSHMPDSSDDEDEDALKDDVKSPATKQAQHRRRGAASSQGSSSKKSGFYMPETASTPVTSHFDAVLECIDLLRHMEADPSVDKQDVIESMHSMLNNMLSTVMMHSFATSMSVSGWRVVE